MNWTYAVPIILAAFMASLVEFVEALTVVLAIGSMRGWCSALIGTVSALLVLMLLVLIFGQSLAQFPLPVVQLVIGTLLLMFGLRWLRKAILRSAEVIALHDEAAAFATETESLRKQVNPMKGVLDKLAFSTAFKIVLLEGVEVVFIVIAIGASGGSILLASLGALAALLVVIMLGIWLHRPLGNIPENTLKFGVGVLLAAFGTFWAGEGVHLIWPGKDWAIFGLIVVYFIFAYMLVIICRMRCRFLFSLPKKNNVAGVNGRFAHVVDEVIALFVDDASLAIGIVVWVIIVWLAISKLLLTMPIMYAVFTAGFALLLAYSVMRAAIKT